MEKSARVLFLGREMIRIHIRPSSMTALADHVIRLLGRSQEDFLTNVLLVIVNNRRLIIQISMETL